MKIKKIKLIFIIFIYLYIFFNSSVKAITYADLIDKYKKNPNIISELTSAELTEWEERVDYCLNILENGSSNYGAGSASYNKEKLEEIKTLIDARQADEERENNTDPDETNGTGESDEELKNKTFDEIRQWLYSHSATNLSTDVKSAWKATIEAQRPNGIVINSTTTHDELDKLIFILDGGSLSEYEESQIEQPETPSGPSTGILGESTASGDHTADDVINDAKNFIQAGKDQDSKIDSENLKKASDTLYNILLSIAIVIAVVVGMYLGVKFMMSSAEDKAKVKESLIPYIAGCVVIFGAFIIWKLAILLLNKLA